MFSTFLLTEVFEGYWYFISLCPMHLLAAIEAELDICSLICNIYN